MSPGGKPRLLFGAYMAGGNATILQNLQDVVSARPDVDADWLRIEMDAESARLDRRPRRSILPGTIRNSLVTGERIAALERGARPFDAAYFFQQTICMFLWRFRRRVPYLIALDGTPLWYAKNDLWYAQPRFDPTTLPSRLKHELTRRVYAGAFHLLPLSWSCRDSLMEDYGIPAARITVVPPGIDLARYAAPDRAVPRPPGLPFNVLFVGADFKRKGGDLLVALASQPEFQDVQFNLVTRSYQGPALPNVRVHDGLTTNSEPMLRLYREADAYLLPTRADSHAIASLEAMAMGLPVVTCPVGGVVDVVEDGKTGYLVARDDLQALAGHLRRLRADAGLRLALGQAARRRVEERFEARAVAATVVGLMLRAAAERARRA